MKEQALDEKKPNAKSRTVELRTQTAKQLASPSRLRLWIFVWIAGCVWLAYSKLHCSDGIISRYNKAKAIHDRTIAGQSKTLKDAMTRYEQRYGISPPRGFSEWFKYAQQHDALIDEYDGLMEDLIPFRNLSGLEIRQRTEALATASDVSMITLSPEGMNISLSKVLSPDVKRWGSERGSAFVDIIKTGGFLSSLSNMSIAINERAESRILDIGKEISLPLEKVPDWRGEGSTWGHYSKLCNSTRYISIQRHSEEFDEKLELRDEEKIDYCASPGEHHTHGIFFSNFRTIDTLMPLFSNGKAVAFKDILIPSSYHWKAGEYYQIENETDTPWNLKTDKLWWRGASSGGGYYPSSYDYFHRQRFVRIANTLGNQNVFMKLSGRQWTPYTDRAELDVRIAILNVNRTDDDAALNQFDPEMLLDVAFTEAMECGDYCKEMELRYRFTVHSHMQVNWKHKFLMDLDGYGYSARFRSFLESSSLVFKSTIIREWFSDRVIPWLHYVPVSTRYNEIAPIWAWFLDPRGQKHAQRMAAEATRAIRTHVRRQDMMVYVYRLLIEWARIISDDREGMSFSE